MLTTKQINAKIAGVKKSTESLRSNIQTILINVAGQAFQHNDVDGYNRLVAATRGMNRKLIMKWASEFGFAQFDKDGKAKLNKTAKKNADFQSGEEVVMYLALEAPEWHSPEDSPAAIAKQLDAAKRIAALASAIDTAIDNHSIKELDQAAMIKSFQALTASLGRAGVDVTIH